MTIPKYFYVGFAKSMMMACILIFSAGCTFTPIYGLYDGSECPGWNYYLDGGVCVYRRHGYQPNEAYITIAGKTPGQLVIYIHPLKTESITIPDQPVTFRENRIKILSRKNELLSETEASTELILTGIPVTEEFAVIIPPFNFGNRLYPELKARLRWSDRKVYSTQHIFGS